MPIQTANGLTPAQNQFLIWLKNNHPRLFAAVQRKVKAGQLAGLGATASSTSTSSGGTNLWGQITGAISNLGTAYLTYTTQQKVLDTQLQRAKQGLPPLNASQLQMPANQVQVGVSSQTGQQIASGLTQGMKAYALPLGIAAVGLVAVMAMGKGKRRRH